MRMRRFRVTPAVNVGLHDFTRGVNVVAIYAGAVIFVLTDDLERANRSAVSFSTAGYPGRRSLLLSVQVGFLSRKFTTIDGRPECVSGRFDVTRSLILPAAVKAARAAASGQNCESRFIIGIRASPCKVEASLRLINIVRRASTKPWIETPYHAVNTTPCWKYSSSDEMN